MRRAAKVDENQQAIVDALRGAGASVVSLAGVGNGCPDLLVGVGLDLWLMEVKHPGRSKNRRAPNALQQEWHARWKAKPVVVVLTPAEALAAIGVTA